MSWSWQLVFDNLAFGMTWLTCFLSYGFDHVLLKCNTATDVFNYLLFGWVCISRLCRSRMYDPDYDSDLVSPSHSQP